MVGLGISAINSMKFGSDGMEPLGWVANSTMPQESSHNLQMDVSENSGTPKSSISIGFSIINHPFWGTPIFGNTQINTVNLSKGKHHQPSFSRIPAYHWNIFPIFTGNISSFSVGSTRRQCLATTPGLCANDDSYLSFQYLAEGLGVGMPTKFE